MIIPILIIASRPDIGIIPSNLCSISISKKDILRIIIIFTESLICTFLKNLINNKAIIVPTKIPIIIDIGI